MSLNILLVDDSDVIRMMIERTLKLAEVPVASIHHAANGLQALDILDDHWIDLVLADINMPVMDGAEMLNRMRANDTTHDVPVIIVSTEGATQRIDDLSAKGVSAWIRKPFTPEEIRDVIGGVTGSWRPAPPVDAVLDEVFSAVVETFAFAFPETAEEPITPSRDAGPMLRADIGFEGAVNGALSILAPLSICAEMAENVTGLEFAEEERSLRAADTLAEISNITAGHLCMRLERHAPTHLLPPAVTLEDALPFAPDACTTRSYFVDDAAIGVQVMLRPSGHDA